MHGRSGSLVRSVTTRPRPAPLMLARFPGLLLPAHPATFKVGWPPGPFISFYQGCKFTTIVVNLQPYGQMPESPTVATELPVQRALDPGGPGGAASGVRTRRGGRRRLPEVTEIDCGPEGRFSGRRVGTSAHQARPRRPPCGCGVGWACRRAAHISGAPYRR